MTYQLFITLEPSPTSPYVRALTSGVSLQYSTGAAPNMVSGFSLMSYKRKANPYIGLGYEPVEETMRLKLEGSNPVAAQNALRELLRAQTYSQGDEFTYRLGIRTSGSATFYTYVRNIQVELPENDWSVLYNNGINDIGLTFERVPFSSPSGFMQTSAQTNIVPLKQTHTLPQRVEAAGGFMHPSPIHVGIQVAYPPGASYTPSGILAVTDSSVYLYDIIDAPTSGWNTVTATSASGGSFLRTNTLGANTYPTSRHIFTGFGNGSYTTYLLFGTVQVSGSPMRVDICFGESLSNLPDAFDEQILYNTTTTIYPTTSPASVYLGQITSRNAVNAQSIGILPTNIGTTSGSFAIDTLLIVPKTDTTRVLRITPQIVPNEGWLRLGNFWYDFNDSESTTTFSRVYEQTSAIFTTNAGDSYPYFSYYGSPNLWSEDGSVSVALLATTSGAWSYMNTDNQRAATSIRLGYSALYPIFPFY